MAKKNERFERLIAFISGKGFIYGPEPEIYGGLSGFYTFGPLGKLLKHNVEESIRRVFRHHDLFEVECPTVLPAKVWDASGHLGGFTDPLIKDEKGSIYRVDKLIEEWCLENGVDPSSLGMESGSKEKFLEIIEKHKITAPDGTPLNKKIVDHTLMMKTTIGVDTEAFNRPETATTTYLPFNRYFRFFREKLPFGIFQIGKAFRNEISPRQHVTRGREFTQAEGQIFLYEDQKNNFGKYDQICSSELPLWTEEQQKSGDAAHRISLEDAVAKKLLGSKAYAWTLLVAYELFIAMGIPPDHIRIRQHHSDEKAFYALDAWDIEIKTKAFGWMEVCGVHDRGDYDLTQHEKHSGTDLKAQDNEHKKQTPHILEIAFGTDRPVFTLLDLFYASKEDNGERDLLSIPYRVAPLQVAVLPLVNKLDVEARHVHMLLKNHFSTWYDKSGSVGRRYARMDEIGVPYCVTIDFDAREKSTVTIRDRDSTKQVRVPIERVCDTLKALYEGNIEFEHAGQAVE